MTSIAAVAINDISRFMGSSVDCPARSWVFQVNEPAPRIMTTSPRTDCLPTIKSLVIRQAATEAFVPWR
jgi:hypothetical protein